MNDPEATCWTLIRRAADGDAASRSTFGNAYLPLVRSFLRTRWRGSALQAETEDAVQDVFLECFRQGGPLSRADDQKGDFRGFLFGIVRHVAQRIEARARVRTPKDAPSTIPEVIDDEPRASQVFDRAWARTLIRKAGQLMEERATDAAAQRRVELLRLRFGDGKAIREIAKMWSADLAASHRQYARAREEFRRCLRDVVAFHVVRTEEELDDECRRLIRLLR